MSAGVSARLDLDFNKGAACCSPHVTSVCSATALAGDGHQLPRESYFETAFALTY